MQHLSPKTSIARMRPVSAPLGFSLSFAPLAPHLKARRQRILSKKAIIYQRFKEIIAVLRKDEMLWCSLLTFFFSSKPTIHHTSKSADDIKIAREPQKGLRESKERGGRNIVMLFTKFIFIWLDTAVRPSPRGTDTLIKRGMHARHARNPPQHVAPKTEIIIHLK